MNGVLVIDKPAGPTSFDVVRTVRRLLNVKKAGHTGTLDPMATGVLPLCLEDGTKIAGLITEGDKAYDAVVRLGARTDTQDAEGKVLSEAPVPALNRELIEAALSKFRGTFLQLPPMYSAVKIAGKRLYEHARAGEEVERTPRQVTVYELLLRDFSATELTLSVRSSKGFFVRTLAAEVGEALGCGAHLKALRRTMSGPFSLAQAIPLERLVQLCATEEGKAQVAARLVSLSDALVELPALEVSEKDAAKVLHGVPLELRPPSGPAQPAALQPGATPSGALRSAEAGAGRGKVRVMGPGGRLLAVAEAGPDGRLRYLRVLN